MISISQVRSAGYLAPRKPSHSCCPIRIVNRFPLNSENMARFSFSHRIETNGPKITFCPFLEMAASLPFSLGSATGLRGSLRPWQAVRGSYLESGTLHDSKITGQSKKITIWFAEQIFIRNFSCHIRLLKEFFSHCDINLSSQVCGPENFPRLLSH